MPIDWSKVTVNHVRQACDLFDGGSAVSKRPAKRTFLLYNGKRYPAKFIRGLAYRIATGIELDPNKDFSGGAETARFFANLGLPTSASPIMIMPAPMPAPSTPKPVVQPTVAPAPERHREPQKRALFDLLKKRFGTVVCEAKFPWLVVPKVDELKKPLAAIFQALQKMRRFSTFAKPGYSLQCDFCIPDERLIVEYDERQHFTLQRARALELYPADLAIEFDRQEWIDTCNLIKATDPNPPDRDERRAFYDTLRDILAAKNGHRLIRIRHGKFDWTGEDAEGKMAMAISTASAAAKGPVQPSITEIRKIALVAHDYNLPNSQGLYDYSEHFTQINKLCDDQGCDTILYALYTWDVASTVDRTHISIFGGLKHVQRIILEVGKPRVRSDHVEIWIRGQQKLVLVHQRFAKSTSPPSDKQDFIDDLPCRRIGSAVLMLCGESNIARLKRASKTFEDEFGFSDRLQDLKIRVVLNPIHDYMTRYEMRKKRQFYSRNGRTVVSVWNQGRGKESRFPWTVFHDGEERTAQVQEVERSFGKRSDIRVGILDLAKLRNFPGSL